MAYSIETRINARQLYVQDRKSIGEISKQLSVPEKALYRWRDDEAWDKDLEALATTSINSLKDAFLLIVRQLQEMVADPSKFTNANIDKLSKTIKAIKSLEKDIDKRGNILAGLEEFVGFMRENHPADLNLVSQYLVEFSAHLVSKYG